MSETAYRWRLKIVEAWCDGFKKIKAARLAR
jgi:hypothetical protein